MEPHDETSSSSTHPRIVLGDKVTHVLVPIALYEQLFGGELPDAAIHQIVGLSKDEWQDAGELACRIARNRIKNARKAAGLTQIQLAEKAGMTQSEISRIESAPHKSTGQTLRKIANVLNVNIDALLD